MMRPLLLRRRCAVARPVFLVVSCLVAGLLSVVSAGSASAATTFASTVTNQGNGNCATVPGGAGTSALQLTQAACGSGASQSFTFTPLAGSNDTYNVRTLTSGSCVDVNGASGADNAAVIQYACHTGTNQQFRLRSVSTDTFNLVAVGSGKCVAPAGDNPAGNTALVQLPCTTSASRVWRLAGFPGGGTQDPPTRTVRVWLLRPSDVPYDQRYPDGIAAVMREAQRYYQQELGKTFRLNEPVVQVVTGEHVKSWYENTPNGPDRYWWSVFNMQQELMRRFSIGAPDSRWINVGEVIAEGPGAGGGGGNGWVILCQHDADGAAGINGPMNRWYGGMVHELGHAFGLPDSTSTDGTPMSASFYDYPNTHFNQSQKNAILNGPYGSFLF
jgi:hypothetical protein